jgi:hypothetical protein
MVTAWAAHRDSFEPAVVSFSLLLSLPLISVGLSLPTNTG